MRSQSFAEIALAVRQRADLGGQQNAYGQNSGDNITDSEMQFMIWASTARLWMLIRQNFGANYYFNTSFLSTVGGTYSYQLPYDAVDLIKVGIQQSPGSNIFWNIRPYNVHEQDNYNGLLAFGFIPATSSFYGLRYQQQGQLLTFQPQNGPLPGQIRLQYTPTAPFLCPTLPVAWAVGTYAQGALVSFPVANAGVTTTQVFIALNAGTTGGTAPAFNVPGTVVDGGITWAYKGPLSIFATTFDGIAGWEDFIVLDVAIKCAIKQESSQVQDMQGQKAELVAAIEVEAANRQAGDPYTVDGGWGMQDGGAFGSGYGDFGGGF